MKRTGSRLVAIFVVCLMGLTAFGCGGGGAAGGSTISSGVTRGQVMVRLRWPVRTPSRQIPSGANSVRVIIKSGSQELVNRLLVRPSVNDVTTEEIIAGLPQATLNVDAEAFPNADGSGTPLGRILTNVTVRANESTDLELSLNSTITRVAILPDSIPLFASPMEITAAAYDAGNHLVPSSHWQWESTNPSVLRIEGNGATANLFAVGPGETKIVLTETESGVKAERTFNVKPL